MANEYETLAGIYDRIGMGNFTAQLTPRLLTYVQQNEWAGRAILDLGCGTSPVARWFMTNRPRIQVHGVDYSPAMLAQSRHLFQAQGGDSMLEERSLLNLSGLGTVDMVTAFDVINEIDNLRDLGKIFAGVSECLSVGKLFVFDLHTIEGLARQADVRDRLIINEADLVVYANNLYNYERQAYTREFIIFQEQDEQWQRTSATREERAYPIQAIATLLKRNGFEIQALLDSRLNAIDPNRPGVLRVIFIAVKQ